MTTERKCRQCGCTQNNACVTADGPCHWVAPDLCSRCSPDFRSFMAPVLKAIEPIPATDYRFTVSEEDLFGAEFVNTRKELMRRAYQASLGGHVVKLVCDGETMGFLVSGSFLGPGHPEFEIRKLQDQFPVEKSHVRR